MTGTVRDGDDPTADDRSTASNRQPIDLRLAVVEYADGADRCTVYPPERSGVKRTTTWLSVDRAVVCDLGEMR
jgi:hypothetical protein